MAIGSFADVELSSPDGSGDAAWQEALEAATGKGPEDLLWETPEGIAVPPLFTPADRSLPLRAA